MADFESVIEKARTQAEAAGLKRSDLKRAIREARART
jgi:hypothetical protein